MKKIKKFILVFVVLMVINLVGCNSLKSKVEKYTIDKSGEQSLNNIENIIIEGYYLNINIFVSDKDILSYKLSGDVNLNLTNNIDDKINIISYVKENDLMITLNKDSDLKEYNSTNSLSLDIEIPKAYYKNLSISTSYSNIRVMGITVNELVIDSNEGSMYIENSTSNNLVAILDRVDFISDKVITSKSYMEMTKGNISLKDFNGNLEIYSREAEIDIQLGESNDDIEIWNEKGEIDLYLPKEATFKLDARTKNGYVKCEFPIPINEISSNEGLKGVVFDDSSSVIINNNEGNIKIMKKN